MRQSRVPDEQAPGRAPLEKNHPSLGYSDTDDRVATQPHTVYVLLVGRFECGKSQIVKACHGQSQFFPVHDVNFKLLNGCSFDRFDCSDHEAHTSIAEQLLDRESNGQRISGIIYCHPEEDRILSGATQRNLRVLIELFLGWQELRRLTILVLPSTATATESRTRTVVERLMNRGSLVFNEACVGGATVVAGSWTLEDIASHLRRFSSISPFSPPVAQALTGQYSAHHYVENAFGYYGRRSVELHATTLNQQLTDDNKELKAQIARHQAELEQMASHQPIDKGTPSDGVHERLRQTEREYTSLRSQVQLHNSYEQGEIIRDLKKINDMIGRFGQSVSERLVDTYSQRALNKSPTEVALSDAHDISRLETWLQECREQMALIPDQETLSSGEHLNVDNFFDFLTRARLCNILSEKIFKPFHPFIEQNESSRLNDYYKEVQKQEHQYTGGKWRSVIFQTLCTRLSSQKTTEAIELMAQEFATGLLGPLAEYFFGMGDISLEKRHYNDLSQIFHVAWEWSSRVKTEVIMLGDFHPTTFVPGPFNPVSMAEFEINPHAPHPRVALCTLGLGLVSWQAKGGGAFPDESVLLRTRVLTDTYYISA